MKRQRTLFDVGVGGGGGGGGGGNSGALNTAFGSSGGGGNSAANTGSGAASIVLDLTEDPGTTAPPTSTASRSVFDVLMKKPVAGSAPKAPSPPPSSSKGVIDLTYEGRSFLDVLMKTANLKTPKEDFLLIFNHPPGTSPEAGVWEWKWVPRGSVDTSSLPCVFTTSTLKLSPLRATELSLYTNVQSFECPEGAPIGPPPIRPWTADPGCRLSPSMLKSCLQKAVRRGMEESAIKLAAELWARGPVDACRRLLIIIIEDALLHPAYPLLTWAMMAGSDGEKEGGFKLGPLHASAYLHVVRDICKCPFREESGFSSSPLLGSISPGGGEEEGGGPLHHPWEHHPPKVDKAGMVHLTQAGLTVLGLGPTAIIKSLLARALYGGMGGDMEMLRRAAWVWAQRFAADAAVRAATGEGGWWPSSGWGESLKTFLTPTTTSSSSSSSSSSASSASSSPWSKLLSSAHGTRLASHAYFGPFQLQILLTPTLALGDIPLCGVDHHVSDMVEDLLTEGGIYSSAPPPTTPLGKAASLAVQALKDEGVPVAEVATVLRSAIWHLRSGVNVRKALVGRKVEAEGGEGEEEGKGEGEKEGGDSPDDVLSPGARTAFNLLLPHFDQYSKNILQSRLG